MPNRDISITAFATAYVRAAHQLLDSRPLVFEDPLALKLLGPVAEQRIKDLVDMHQSPEWKYMRSSVVLRSRFAEDRLASAVEKGVNRYVILGAGFDTFAMRQPEWAKSLRILEVDHNGTQKTKREMIEAAGIPVPDNSGFATIDFERESLCDGLARYGVLKDKPTFFSWLGVAMYLREEDVMATLKSVASFAAGSEIVFTYLQKPQEGPPSPFEERVANLGEPFLSYFEPDYMEQKLRNIGFSKTEFLSHKAAEEQYYSGRPNDLPIPKRINIVHAIR